MKLVSSLLAASVVSESVSTLEDQLRQGFKNCFKTLFILLNFAILWSALKDGCISMITSHGFDYAHPLQTREQWIQKWTSKCEKQYARLGRLFYKSDAVTTCGVADEWVKLNISKIADFFYESCLLLWHSLCSQKLIAERNSEGFRLFIADFVFIHIYSRPKFPKDRSKGCDKMLKTLSVLIMLSSLLIQQ